jgi:hypothetical protein
MLLLSNNIHPQLNRYRLYLLFGVVVLVLSATLHSFYNQPEAMSSVPAAAIGHVNHPHIARAMRFFYRRFLGVSSLDEYNAMIRDIDWQNFTNCAAVNDKRSSHQQHQQLPLIPTSSNVWAQSTNPTQPNQYTNNDTNRLY